ncbi:AzlD domain-containing protein [Desulfonatronospira sp.]|uniref:AzlD family protein n=1 Tax=Desulfonatronospira sp. TaxID=1962951 RepID=UPI0025C711A9|nr:AzlD domain-containing protein [Desulfonatronospira sp.]
MLESSGFIFAAAIVLMTAATYITRAGGLFIISRIAPTQRLQAFLNHVPASILVAIIVPSLVDKGPAEFIAAGSTAAAAILTRNLIISLLTGLICVSLLRTLIF